MYQRVLAIWIAVAAIGCSGPVMLLPGGELSGDPTPAPSDWAFAGDYGTVQLESRPSDPYSVNIAYTIVDGQLYINAGDTETQWVKNMAADPNVRLRMEGALYELQAERVTDAAAIDAFGEAWTNQSMFRRDPRELERVWIYQLVAR